MLLHLPLPDILFAQRVSKTWQSLIYRSTTIQQVLYLAPSTITVLSPELIHEKDKGDGSWSWRIKQSVLSENKAVLNPFLGNLLQVRRNRGITILHHGLVTPSNAEGEHHRVDDKTERLHRKNALWRKMLITQPPTERIWLACLEEPTVETIENTHNSGVKISQVVDVLRQHWFTCPNHPVWDAQSDGGEDRWECMGYHYVYKVSLHTSGFNLLARLRSDAGSPGPLGSGVATEEKFG